MDLAPEDRKAAMFGLYYLIRDVIVSLAAFGVVGTAWFVFRGHDLTGRTAEAAKVA